MTIRAYQSTAIGCSRDGVLSGAKQIAPLEVRHQAFPEKQRGERPKEDAALKTNWWASGQWWERGTTSIL